MTEDEPRWDRRFDPLASLAVLRATLRDLGVPDSDLCWVVGDGPLAGLTRAWGIDIVRADVPTPLLAFRSLSQWRMPRTELDRPWPERENLPDE